MFLMIMNKGDTSKSAYTALDRAIKYLPLSILHIKKCALIKPIFFIIAHTLNTTQIFEDEGQNNSDVPLDISSASHPFLYG